jgi:hypothetical protein
MCTNADVRVGQRRCSPAPRKRHRRCVRRRRQQSWLPAGSSCPRRTDRSECNPTNWPSAQMCSSKATAPAKFRTSVCHPRSWPPAARASSTLLRAAAATTGGGQPGRVRHGRLVCHRVHHRRRNPRPACVPPDPVGRPVRSTTEIPRPNDKCQRLPVLTIELLATDQRLVNPLPRRAERSTAKSGGRHGRMPTMTCSAVAVLQR